MTHPQLSLARLSRFATAGALAALLAACGSNVALDDKAAGVPVESRDPSAGAGTGSAGQSGVATVDLSKQQAGAANAVGRIVYSDFDSFSVKEEFRPLLEANAKALAANRAKRMSLEGHTDERGSREYNLALGQKRAEAVARQMVLLGAADNQLEPVSFGKERPAVQGGGESAWAQNRRVELKDK